LTGLYKRRGGINKIGGVCALNFGCHIKLTEVAKSNFLRLAVKKIPKCLNQLILFYNCVIHVRHEKTRIQHGQMHSCFN